jgi:hypothetical protein
MTAWRYANLALIGLLIASLSLKLNGAMQAAGADAADPTLKIKLFLSRAGFEPGATNTDVDLFSVSASSGDCQILVAVLSPQGWHSDVIESLIPPNGKLFVLYDGGIYDHQPVLRTRVNDVLDRTIWSNLYGSVSRPVIGVVASSACATDKLQLPQLAAAIAG